MFHIAFYRFVALPDAPSVARVVRALAAALKGAVIVAKTGINGTLAGSAQALDAFEHGLQHDEQLAGAFLGMRFQRTACQRPPFGTLKISVKADLVQMGFTLEPLTGLPEPHDADFSKDPAQACALNSEQWDALIAESNVVVLDNRNQFEYGLGRFTGAQDPNVGLYADFNSFLQAKLPEWQRAGKRIAMYCTGGIRCEKTGAWLAERGVASYSLDGGVLKYLADRREQAQSARQSGAWSGVCFVFDNRSALDATLKPVSLSPEEIYPKAEDAWRIARARRLLESAPALGNQLDND